MNVKGQAGRIAGRLLLASFCWSTALYAFVTSSAFAYLQFIRPRVFPWVGRFGDWNPILWGLTDGMRSLLVGVLALLPLAVLPLALLVALLLPPLPPADVPCEPPLPPPAPVEPPAPHPADARTVITASPLETITARRRCIGSPF